MASLALGIDVSTQSATGVVLDAREGGDTVHRESVHYDRTFPDYGTEGGVLPHEDPAVSHTDPRMLLDALEALLARIAADAPSLLGEVEAVKIDAMQHATVYVDERFPRVLRELDPGSPLSEQVAHTFTRDTAPIWEDRSPVREVEHLREEADVLSLTANPPERRFPAAQIMRWAKEDPEAYRRTDRVYVLSAFLSSVLAGRPVPVDTGDGWGTNLNHRRLEQPGWSDEMLSVVDRYLDESGGAGPLAERLGSMVPYDEPVGEIGDYFAARHGLSSEAAVLAGTGDNPATLLGCGGSAVVSLGTSYTVNGRVEAVDPSPERNHFGYTPGKVMALTCFTNGARLHDHFLSRYLGERVGDAPSPDDWEEYVRRAGPLELGADEPLMLPYLQEESVPERPAGILRDGLEDGDPAANIRALHLSQALALRCHADHLGAVDSMAVVGGAAKNERLRQFISDAFGAETFLVENAELAAPFGAALSGVHWMQGTTYRDVTDRFVRTDPSSRLSPRPANRDVMPRLLERYRNLERSVQ